MRGSTFLLGPSSFDCRNAGKISIFVSLSPLSLSLSLFDFFSSSSPIFYSSPPFSFLIHRTYFYFCLFPHLIFSFSNFSIFFNFSHFSFLSSSLLFLFLHFLFSTSHLDCINRMVKKWGKLPPTFLLCHLSLSHFFLIFMTFLFP